VAAVLVEPVAANMGLVPGDEAFLATLRRRCDEHGALLVFDEVITGFRIGPAGVQGLLGATPDVTLLGKVLGGGLPLAAVGGRAAVMDELAPVGPVYQAGTLSGNPLATAAGLAALSLLDDDAYTRLEAIATRVADGLTAAFAAAGVDAQVPRARTLVGLFFSDAPVRDYHAAHFADHKAYASFFHGLLDRGVYVAPSGYEALFPSLAHGDTELDHTLAAAEAAAARRD
jgi:glutamate-1-semialdehyde 2,1-aminomutase